MDVQWIDRTDQLESFFEGVDGILAVDTESDHFHAYNARVCLIQLATREAAALVDPLALDAESLSVFLENLEDDSTVKVFHAGRNDIGELDRDYGIEVRGFFDTQIACRFLGKGGAGLSWMLDDFFDVKTSKKYQRFDWTTRPIPAEPKEYAATDVLYLIEARERLLDELEEAGWLEPCLQQCRWVARATAYSANPFNPEGWRRLRGTDKLNDESRSVLASLWVWRHELCEEINQAALHVIKDGALMKLTRKKPDSKNDLTRIGGIADVVFDEHADELLDVIAQARGKTPPPKELERERRPRKSAEEYARFKGLKKWRNKTVNELGIPSEFLATNATLSEIAADPPKDTEALAEFGEILPWQLERFGAEIVRIANR